MRNFKDGEYIRVSSLCNEKVSSLVPVTEVMPNYYLFTTQIAPLPKCTGGDIKSLLDCQMNVQSEQELENQIQYRLDLMFYRKKSVFINNLNVKIEDTFNEIVKLRYLINELRRFKLLIKKIV